MTDGRDDGNFRSRHCPYHDFFVKGPQVFHGAAAAADDEHVRQPVFIHETYGVGDVPCRRFSLYLNRVQQQLHPGIPAPCHFYDIPHRRSCRGGDDAHGFRVGRDWFLSFFREEALLFQFLLQFFISQHQAADAFLNQHVRVQLVHAVGFIDADAADGHHGVPVVGIAQQLPGLTLEHDAFQHTACVF